MSLCSCARGSAAASDADRDKQDGRGGELLIPADVHAGERPLPPDCGAQALHFAEAQPLTLDGGAVPLHIELEAEAEHSAMLASGER